MNRKSVFWGALVVFFAIHVTCLTVEANTIDPNQYYTWGISNDELFIPAGQIITEAVLTIHGITNQAESEYDILYIYLIDNPQTGFEAYVDNISGDTFGNPGVIMEPPYQDFTEGKEELKYMLSQLNDESSSVWQVFNYPFDLILSDSSTVTYSSSLLTIIDYAGTGTSFGFGFDPNGINGYQFDGFSLEITIESYLGPPEKSLLTFTYGITNWPPALAIITDKYIAENAQLSFSINATDADGDAVIYSAADLPTGATFAGDTFTWTPAYDQAGTYQVTFIASDGQDTDYQTIAITVYDINRAPVLSNIGAKNTNENQTLTFSINATDADGDAVIYRVPASVLPTGAIFAGDTFTWTPTYDQARTYQVTFIASDGQNADYQTITITVYDINRAPVLDAIENKSVIARKILIFGINATDPDGDSINYSVQNLPKGAAFSGNTFSWTPWYDQIGSHAVSFIAGDGSSDSSKTITITVTQPEIASWYEAWLNHLGLI